MCGTAQLQSPVFVNSQVVVSSYNGRLYRLNTSGTAPYACVASAQAGTGTSLGGALSPPVIDVTNNQIIVTTNDALGFGIAGIGTFDLMFASGASYTVGVSLGDNGTTMPVTPTFDDVFWSTNNGNVYAVGAPTAGGDTYLIRLPYTAGALGSAAGYAHLQRSGAASVVDVTPVTEFLTASSLTNKDFVFVGGGGGTYLFMNRIGAGFAGTNASPVNMDSSVRRDWRRRVGYRRRHADLEHHRIRRRPRTSTSAPRAWPRRRRAPSSSWRSSSDVFTVAPAEPGIV